MKKWLFVGGVLWLAFSVGSNAAVADSAESSGKIEFNDSELLPEGVVDPEHPETVVNPGESPSTDGYLRLDFVPKFVFGRWKISDKDQSYAVHGQLFHDNTPARANFVQVTDSRLDGGNWTLQVRQDQEFEAIDDPDNKIEGSYISLGDAWVNSVMDAKLAPNVLGDVIKIDKIGVTYDLAKADPMKGYGTWSISFGASAENLAGKKDTLVPLLDEKGQPILDPKFGDKPMYSNEAVTYFVPGASVKKTGAYQTVLTWIISELP